MYCSVFFKFVDLFLDERKYKDLKLCAHSKRFIKDFVKGSLRCCLFFDSSKIVTNFSFYG